MQQHHPTHFSTPNCNPPKSVLALAHPLALSRPIGTASLTTSHVLALPCRALAALASVPSSPLPSRPNNNAPLPLQSRIAPNMNSRVSSEMRRRCSASLDEPSHSETGVPQANQGASVLKVLLYLPNLVDYLRIILMLVSFCWLPSSFPHLFLLLYLTNFLLDGVDGILARRLNQKSYFGAFLDVAIDNTLRSLMWSKALKGHWAATVIPSIEWLVFSCTHSQALSARGVGGSNSERARGWKESFDGAPWWVSTVMANGFKNPAGILTIAGIHFLPLWLWLHTSHPHLLLLSPFASWLLGATLACGRLLGLATEIWVLTTHCFLLLLDDVSIATKQH